MCQRADTKLNPFTEDFCLPVKVSGGELCMAQSPVLQLATLGSGFALVVLLRAHMASLAWPLQVGRRLSRSPLSKSSTQTLLMKKLALSFVSILAAGCLASCASGPNAQRGTVIGALGGAAAGGIIGNQSGRGLEGAAIGAGLGGLAGNAIGDARDRENYQTRYYSQTEPRYYR